MPGFDGTGPFGMGPQTGGGFGYCGGRRRIRGAGFGARPFRGRGFGLGRAWRGGRGWAGFGGWGLWGSQTPEEERQAMEDELRLLEERSAYLRERLENRTGTIEENKK